ncbi:hypothetical protein JOD54_003720 [Actinokineospora baliensis]|uniref:hypothetical protein n=1 Tax=Actinokineospora baliensis TaxID=547056 RepID=UPI001EF861F9|nr:hypothetical protein [Actinokineospora baliensis]MBM7773516.1 hypothetical protein [Actinokineospora baliensis]
MGSPSVLWPAGPRGPPVPVITGGPGQDGIHQPAAPLPAPARVAGGGPGLAR